MEFTVIVRRDTLYTIETDTEQHARDIALDGETVIEILTEELNYQTVLECWENETKTGAL